MSLPYCTYSLDISRLTMSHYIKIVIMKMIPTKALKNHLLLTGFLPVSQNSQNCYYTGSTISDCAKVTAYNSGKKCLFFDYLYVFVLVRNVHLTYGFQFYKIRPSNMTMA